MKPSIPSLPTLFGERTPIGVALLLLAVGLALGLWDATLWASALAREAPPAAPRPAVLPTVAASAPTVPSPPADPPIQAPAAKAAQPSSPPTAEAQDCPPLFPIAFALGSAVPQFDEAALATLVEWLLSHPQASLVVDGHSDSLGAPGVNLALSQRRAGQMVRRFLAANLPRDRITRRAFGNYNPVVGAREDAPQNRRVVLSVAGLKNCPESP